MRYFTNGVRVARVHTEEPFGDQFLRARAETFHIVKNEWIERPNIAGEIMFRGEWETITQADAEKRIAERQQQRKTA